MYLCERVRSRVSRVVRNRIELTGVTPEADRAEEWATERARAARFSHRAASKYGRLVRDAYLAACEVLVATRKETPTIRISVEDRGLKPKIELITGRQDR